MKTPQVHLLAVVMLWCGCASEGPPREALPDTGHSDRQCWPPDISTPTLTPNAFCDLLAVGVPHKEVYCCAQSNYTVCQDCYQGFFDTCEWWNTVEDFKVHMPVCMEDGGS
jgi:hypothetical protein